MGKIVEIPSNGGAARGYLAVPKSGSGPGVLVIQEWWGLVRHIENVCERFATAGFTALAPDLYHGSIATEPDEAGKLMMALNADEAAKDMSSAVDYLLSHDAVTSSKVGVMGFCMGGGLALVLACAEPDTVGPVAPFYGLIPWPDIEPDWAQLSGPVRGNYAENDDMFGPDKVHELQAKLDGLGKEADLKIFPGCDHAFFNDDRPDVYQPESANKAWERTVDLFRTSLT